MTADEIRDATHHTHELYGVPFMYPDVRQGPVVAKLSLARAIAREAEVAALLAFSAGDRDGRATRRRAARAPDLAHALNRISSALYLLAVQVRRRPLRGQPPPDGPGPRVEAPRDDDQAPRTRQPAAVTPSPRSRRGWPRSTTPRSCPLYAARFAALLAARPRRRARARACSRSAAPPAS